jgi:hypothetical protein
MVFYLQNNCHHSNDCIICLHTCSIISRHIFFCISFICLIAVIYYVARSQFIWFQDNYQPAICYFSLHSHPTHMVWNTKNKNKWYNHCCGDNYFEGKIPYKYLFSKCTHMNCIFQYLSLPREDLVLKPVPRIRHTRDPPAIA